MNCNLSVIIIYFLYLYINLAENKKIKNMSLIKDVMYYGNWVISILNFIYWAYQLISSFMHYLRIDKTNEGRGSTLGIHVLLFAANALYVFYEL